jgi:hypothetical protein
LRRAHTLSTLTIPSGLITAFQNWMRFEGGVSAELLSILITNEKYQRKIRYKCQMVKYEKAPTTGDPIK